MGANQTAIDPGITGYLRHSGTKVALPQDRFVTPLKSDVDSSNSEAGPGGSAPARTEAVKRVFVYVAWSVMMLGALFFVYTYSTNVPYQDYWELVPVITGNQAVTLSWLWEAHNEHRIPLPKLILLALHWLTKDDFRAGMVANVILLGAIALGMIQAARSARGRTSYADAFFPVVLLHPGHCENLLWSWQISFVLSTALAAVFLLVVVFRTRLSWRAGLLAGTCLMLLPLCGANGAVLVPSLALWLAVSALFSWWRTSDRRQLPAFGLALASIALVGFYAVGFKGSEPQLPASSVSQLALTALQFLSLAFGYISLSWWTWWAAGAVVLLFLSYAILIRTFIGRPEERARSFGLIAFLCAMLTLACAISWGRGAIGPYAVLFSFRYVSLAVLWPCCAFFTLLLYGGRGVGRFVQNALFVCSLVMLWPNYENGVFYGRTLHGSLVGFERDIETGVHVSFLVDRYSQYPFPMYPDAQRLKALLAMLHEAGIKPFQNLRQGPPLREVPLAPDAYRNEGYHLYRFKDPPLALGLRLRCEFQKSAPRARALILWQYESPQNPGRLKTGSRLLEFAQDREKGVMIYLDGIVHELQFQLDTAFRQFEVAGITLILAGDESEKVPHVR
jgi:hypothetical protein